MKCHECRELLSPFVDNMTSEEENNKIKAHLALCPDCSRELERMRLIIEGLGELKGDVAVPEGFREEIHERLLMHKTSLWGKRHVTGHPRAGGWIAASIAALALGAGVFLSSLVPVGQVAELFDRVSPSVLEKQNVKIAVDKLIAQKESELRRQETTSPVTEGKASDSSAQVASDVPLKHEMSGNGATIDTDKNQVVDESRTVATVSADEQVAKTAQVVAMQVEVKDADRAAQFLLNEGASRRETVVLSDNNVRTLSASRTQVVTIQVPADKVAEWTDLIQQLGTSSAPVTNNEDLTLAYNNLEAKKDEIQKKLDEAKQLHDDRAAESLRQKLAECDLKLAELKQKMQLVTITVVLKENN